MVWPVVLSDRWWSQPGAIIHRLCFAENLTMLISHFRAEILITAINVDGLTLIASSTAGRGRNERAEEDAGVRNAGSDF